MVNIKSEEIYREKKVHVYYDMPPEIISIHGFGQPWF